MATDSPSKDYRVDLHTHSSSSADGGITANQYKKALANKLDYIAITDHNRIDLAIKLKVELGPKIIIGEEIMTTSGEIIGLFLNKVISSGMSATETINAIKDQGGLVYIPHPFDKTRTSLSVSTLNNLAEYIDIIEIHNGRAFFKNYSAQALSWSLNHSKIGAASSDAHGYSGLGYTYSCIKNEPITAKILRDSLKSSKLVNSNPPLKTLFYPKFHKLKNSFFARGR